MPFCYDGPEDLQLRCYMLLEILAVVLGIVFLILSADKFVEGASGVANYFGMPPLLIGMVIVGFGTSAPEMLVSTLASLEGKPALALGNAYGSNISNIGLILGISALIGPISVESKVLKKELPILIFISVLSGFFVYDAYISRLDSLALLFIFLGLMGWSIYEGMQKNEDALSEEIMEEIIADRLTISKSMLFLLAGLAVLILSSRTLVWGAVGIATRLGVSELIIGLTIVAIGTSLPELASSVAAVRKGQSDIALGNVIGSNLFNTLAVVGLAGVITPFDVASEVLSRDVVAMNAITIALLFLCLLRRRAPQLTRLSGSALLCAYFGYNYWLLS